MYQYFLTPSLNNYYCETSTIYLQAIKTCSCRIRIIILEGKILILLAGDTRVGWNIPLWNFISIVGTFLPSRKLFRKYSLTVANLKTNYFLPTENFVQRSWVFATNSDFLITISLEPNDVDLRYFKLWILLDQIIWVWNIKGLQHRVLKILRFKYLILFQILNSFSLSVCLFVCI